jgi:hypothetical protein
VSASVIGALRVNLGLDSAQFERGAKKAQDSLGTMRTQFLAVAAVAASVGSALSAMALKGAADIDAAAKAGRRLGTSVGGYRALEMAADDAGVSLSSLADSVQTMDREIAKGSAGAVAALSTLGLAASDLEGLEADQKLALVADRVADLGLSTGQTTALLQGLGIRQRDMVLLLSQGGDALRAARQDVDEFGLAISAIDTRRIEAANDEIAGLADIGTYLRDQLALKIVPSLGAMAKAMTDSLREGGTLRIVIDGLIGNLERMASIIAVAVTGFGVRYVAAFVLARVATVALAGSLTVLRAAIIRTGIGALIVGAGELVYQFTRLVNGAGGFGEALTLLKDVAIEVWDRIGDGAYVILYRVKEVMAQVRAAFFRGLAGLTERWGAFIEVIAGGMAALPGGLATAALLRATVSGDPEGLRASATEAEATADAMARAGARVRDAMTAPLDSVQALRDAVRETEDAADGATGATTDFTDAVEGAGGAARGAAADTEDLAEALDGPLSSAVDGVSKAWADFVVRGFRDFKGFVRSVLDSFKGMLAEMIATAARNRIIVGLGLGGGGSVAGAAANAATGAVGAGGGILGTIGSIGSALFGGFTKTASAFLGGGFGAASATIGKFFGTAGGTLTGIAGAIGAIAAPLAAVGAVFSFFRKKVTELDSGLRVTADNLGVLVESFRKTETSRFWGLSKKIRTTFDTAAAEIAEPVTAAIEGIQASVAGVADLLGKDASIFDGWSYQFTLSLKDLDEAAQQAALAEEFNKLGTSLIELVPDLERLGAANMDFAATMQQVEAVLSQRYEMETRILQLQGDTAALRAREMERTVEFNRDLLQTIFDLEDAAESARAAAQAAADAMARIRPEDFATAFDFQRAAARAQMGLGAVQAGPISYAAPAAPDSTAAQSGASVQAEIALLREEARQFYLSSLRHEKKTADTLEKWDAIGLPETQL